MLQHVVNYLKTTTMKEAILKLRRVFYKHHKKSSLRDGVLLVLAWVPWMACLRRWRGWRAYVGGVGGVLAWVACYYYCYCYY